MKAKNKKFRQGWQCPKCGAILSPDQGCCPFCVPFVITCGMENIFKDVGLSIFKRDIPKTEEEVEAEINELFPINLEGILEGIHDDERNEKKT